MSDIVRARKEGEPKEITNGDPVIFSEGRIGGIIHFPVLVDKGRGYEKMTFEKFVRPPGTRIMAVQDDKIYMQKERRMETEGFDWRLPGGKVINTFKEYSNYINKPLPEEMILDAGRRELKEEAHLAAESVVLFQKRPCGATVEWDLYYIIATNIVEERHDGHDESEEIAEGRFIPFDEVIAMCHSGEIREGRTVSALLQYINQQK